MQRSEPNWARDRSGHRQPGRRDECADPNRRTERDGGAERNRNADPPAHGRADLQADGVTDGDPGTDKLPELQTNGHADAASDCHA
jgi:hypothetical protein